MCVVPFNGLSRHAVDGSLPRVLPFFKQVMEKQENGRRNKVSKECLWIKHTIIGNEEQRVKSGLDKPWM